MKECVHAVDGTDVGISFSPNFRMNEFTLISLMLPITKSHASQSLLRGNQRELKEYQNVYLINWIRQASVLTFLFSLSLLTITNVQLLIKFMKWETLSHARGLWWYILFNVSTSKTLFSRVAAHLSGSLLAAVAAVMIQTYHSLHEDKISFKIIFIISQSCFFILCLVGIGSI